jgi:hypothetical protein
LNTSTIANMTTAGAGDHKRGGSPSAMLDEPGQQRRVSLLGENLMLCKSET